MGPPKLKGVIFYSAPNLLAHHQILMMHHQILKFENNLTITKFNLKITNTFNSNITKFNGF